MSRAVNAETDLQLEMANLREKTTLARSGPSVQVWTEWLSSASGLRWPSERLVSRPVEHSEARERSARSRSARSAKWLASGRGGRWT